MQLANENNKVAWIIRFKTKVRVFALSPLAACCIYPCRRNLALTRPHHGGSFPVTGFPTRMQGLDPESEAALRKKLESAAR